MPDKQSILSISDKLEFQREDAGKLGRLCAISHSALTDPSVQISRQMVFQNEADVRDLIIDTETRLDADYTLSIVAKLIERLQIACDILEQQGEFEIKYGERWGECFKDDRHTADLLAEKAETLLYLNKPRWIVEKGDESHVESSKIADVLVAFKVAHDNYDRVRAKNSSPDSSPQPDETFLMNLYELRLRYAENCVDTITLSLKRSETLINQAQDMVGALRDGKMEEKKGAEFVEDCLQKARNLLRNTTGSIVKTESFGTRIFSMDPRDEEFSDFQPTIYIPASLNFNI